MGHPTPTADQLRKSGARKSRIEEAEARENPQPVPKAVRPEGLPKPKLTEVYLTRCAKSLPGYDPWAQRGRCIFDWERARKAVAFFHDRLTHVKGGLARAPLVLNRWQIGIVANLFGWYRPDGWRRYRECFIFVARKNGKTVLAAGLLLYLLDQDNEPGAEIIGAAAEYHQASLVFEHARGMILQDPLGELAGKYRIIGGQQKAIVTLDRFSSYRVVASTPHTRHGGNTHAVVIDELHAIKGRDLVDVLMTGTGNRDQPLVIHITTAGFDKETICGEKYDYACAVRDGRTKNAEFLPVIYEAGPKDDWRKVGTWRKANPNYGVSIRADYLKAECKRAQSTPSYLNTFKRLHGNLWTQTEEVWITDGQWQKCGGAIDWDALRDVPCCGGLDLASVGDTTAFALVFPETPEPGHFTVWCDVFIPREGAIERDRLDGADYLTWAREGCVHLTPGNAVDYSFVRARILKLAERFNIMEIAFDRWQAEETRQKLEDELGIPMVEYGQGYKSMSAPSKRWEQLVLTQQLHHGDNPVLRWMVGNTSIQVDPTESIKPVKDKHRRKRIDGVVASVMALGRAMVLVPKKPSVYTQRSLHVLNGGREKW